MSFDPRRRRLALGALAAVAACGARGARSGEDNLPRVYPDRLPPASEIIDPRLLRTIHVGPDALVRTLAEAARLARDGDVVEVTPGEYVGDVAVWNHRRLTIRCSGGVARLRADDKAAEAKAIWVMRNGPYTIEGFEFRDCRVPDRNGAGIRIESGSLTVRNCRFEANENGILSGSDPNALITIEDCVFSANGSGDGYSHNLYIGAAGRLVVTGSYFRAARVGHLLKSRAAENRVHYNRLTDEDGTASYELEFPNGGLAIVVGNVIQQSRRTENPAMISFGAEGYRNADNRLYVVHNTIINDRAEGGEFVYARPGASEVRVQHNVTSGNGTMRLPPGAIDEGNLGVPAAWFADAARYDYRLKRPRLPIGVPPLAPAAGGVALVPEREFRAPAGSVPLAPAERYVPGALQRPAD